MPYNHGFQTFPRKYPNLPPEPQDYQWVIQARATSLAYPDLKDFVNGKWPVVVNPNNSTAVPANIDLADGWKVASGFIAGTLDTIAPTQNPARNSHGIWGDAAMTPPALDSLIDSANVTILGCTQLDTDLFVVLWHNSTDIKAAAFRISTGDIGAAATICTYNNTRAAYIGKCGAASFCAGGHHAAANYTFRAGSVDTTTLAITLGAAVLTAIDLYQVVRLSDSLVAMVQNTANGLRAADITGTVVTLGAAAASGSTGDGSNGVTMGVLRIQRSTNTQFVACIIQAGGGTATTRAIGVRTVDVTAGTAALTANAISSGGNILANTSLRVLVAVTEGTSYIAVAQQGAVGTSGEFYGVQVAAGNATVGATTTRALDLPAAATADFGAWIYKTGGVPYARYDADTVLFGHLSTGVYAASIAGTVLTFGATLAFAAAKNFLYNAAADGTIYAVSSGVFDKLSVAANVVTSSWQVAATPTMVKDDNLTNVAVNYEGTWYAWTLGTIGAVVSSTHCLFASGATISLCGPLQ